MSRALAGKRDDFFGKAGSSLANGYTRTGSVDQPTLEDTISTTGLQHRGGSLSSMNSSVSGGGGSGNHIVGFSNLPSQVHRRALRRGFEFNLMVVGCSGLGKSTLINSLFLTELYTPEHQGPSKRIKKTVYVESTTVLLKERDVQLKLTLVDTPGFGDAVDNSGCFAPVEKWIESRCEEFLTSETRLLRRQGGGGWDPRVHACLYFIQPTGHGLKPLDIEAMKRLQDKVNLIPVIAKADTLTSDECKEFKRLITADFAQHKIRVYDFPDLAGIEESRLTELRKYRERSPFALVGSANLVDSSKGSGKVRGRVYPWGTVEVDSLEHNDFLALRHLLLKTHLQDLRDTTNTIVYENYRQGKLSEIVSEGNFVSKDGKDPMAQMEAEKKEHQQRMKRMETDMQQVFEQKVKEKLVKQRESEKDLELRAEQMRVQLEAQLAEVEAEHQQLEATRRAWEEANRETLERMGSGIYQAGDTRSSAEKLADKLRTKKKGFF